MKFSTRGGFVATIVAGPETELTDDLLHILMGQLHATEREWLAPHHAADIFFNKMQVNAAYIGLKNFLQDLPFDVMVQPIASRRKKLLIADMESTIIEEEMLDELADLIDARALVADITLRAMNGELDFTAALRERVALFKGQPDTLLKTAAAKITCSPGAEALVATMKKDGAACWLVSGGFKYFVHPVADKLGFDASYANDLIVQNGTVAGEVREPILGKEAKADYLRQAVADLRLNISDAMSVGDGANDVPLLKACNDGGGFGVAYMAKPNVRMAVPNQINYTDLTTLLYAQGYKKDEIISSYRR